MDPQWLLVAGGGVAGGLVLLGRGFGAYRVAARILDTAPSRIASAAVGEVLVSGVIERAELSLISPLQSVPCVFYRSRVDESGRDEGATLFREEAAVGFRIRDESGEMRVFPRDARFDVPPCFDETTGMFGDAPAGLRLRSGPAYGLVEDREAQIAELLTVHAAAADGLPDEGGGQRFAGGMRPHNGRSRQYTEARLAFGDAITVIGRAMPFDQLADPMSADVVNPGLPAADDPEIAADLTVARAAGRLASSPEEAWGNAAIPGFGIGSPVREPELDGGADEPELANSDAAARYRRTFEIEPGSLVLAAAPDVPLVIAAGVPTVAAGRRQREFLIGLLGAVLAIVSAMALALLAGGEIAT